MKVLCSNGIKSVMIELGPAWEREAATSLAIVWGSTVALMKEIASGIPAHLAVLTGEAIDELIASGKAMAGTRIDLARSAIGIAVRKGAAKPDIGTPEALRDALLAARSIGLSKTGISGIYFPTVLERLGIGDAVKSKLIIPERPIGIGELIANGEVELGIQQISELLPVDGIDIVGPLPALLQKITTFSAAVLTTSGDEEGARKLVDFIAARSRPLLAAKGLQPP